MGLKRLEVKVEGHLPPNVVNIDGAMINGYTVCVLCRQFTTVVVVMLDLLSCCPGKDIRGLVGIVRGESTIHTTAAAVVHLEHRSGTSILRCTEGGGYCFVACNHLIRLTPLTSTSSSSEHSEFPQELSCCWCRSNL